MKSTPVTAATVAAALVLSLGAVGCDRAPESGRVLARDHTPAHTTTQCSGADRVAPARGGRGGVAHRPAPRPASKPKGRTRTRPKHKDRDFDNGPACTTRHHPEIYELQLKKGQEQGWREVGRGDHRSCTPGDRYPDCAR